MTKFEILLVFLRCMTKLVALDSKGSSLWTLLDIGLTILYLNHYSSFNAVFPLTSLMQRLLDVDKNQNIV